MWNHYGNQGVAIVSHALSLAYGEAIPNLGELTHAAGSVQYIDHSSVHDWPKNYFAPFFAKRVGLQSEREVRIVIGDEYTSDDTRKNGGIKMPIDLTGALLAQAN